MKGNGNVMFRDLYLEKAHKCSFSDHFVRIKRAFMPDIIAKLLYQQLSVMLHKYNLSPPSDAINNCERDADKPAHDKIIFCVNFKFRRPTQVAMTM